MMTSSDSDGPLPAELKDLIDTTITARLSVADIADAVHKSCGTSSGVCRALAPTRGGVGQGFARTVPDLLKARDRWAAYGFVDVLRAAGDDS